MTANSAPPTAARRKSAWKIILSVVVATSALSGLLWASLDDGAEYYKYVDEVTKDVQRLSGKRVRVHGVVVEGSLDHQPGTLDYRFKLESKAPRDPAVISVDFHGIPPDTFKSGTEAIAAGTLGSDGKLTSDRIETKCPSKYETKEGK